MPTRLVYHILQLQLIIAVAGSAGGELAGSEAVIRSLDELGITQRLLPVLAITKLIALGTILLPGRFWRVKEWGFAALTFVFAGTLYLSSTSGTSAMPQLVLLPVYLVLTLATYWAYARSGYRGRRPNRFAFPANYSPQAKAR